MRKIYGLPFHVLKHMLLWNHIEFSPGRESTLIKEWKNRGINIVEHQVNKEEKRWMIYAEETTKYSLYKKQHLPYMQLISFLHDRLYKVENEAYSLQS